MRALSLSNGLAMCLSARRVLTQLEMKAMQEVLERRRQQHGHHRQEKHAAEERVGDGEELARGVTTGFTGPMPVRIIVALSAASSRGKSSKT